MTMTSVSGARCDIMGRERNMKICSVAGTKVRGGFKLPPPEEIKIGPPPHISRTQKYTWELEFDRRVSAHDLAILFDRFHSVLNRWQKTIKLPKE